MTPEQIAYPNLPVKREHQCLDHWTGKPRTVDGRPAIVQRGNVHWCVFHHRAEAIIPEVARPTWDDTARQKAQAAYRKKRQASAVEIERRAAYYVKHRDRILALRRAEREGRA